MSADNTESSNHHSLPTDSISPPELSVIDSQNLVQQGKAFYASGRLVEAAELLQQAVQNYQKQGDILGQTTTLSNPALVYQKLGLFSEANQAIGNSLKLLGSGLLLSTCETGDRLQILAQMLEIQGSLQFEQGQPERALTIWQKSNLAAWEISERKRMR